MSNLDIDEVGRAYARDLAAKRAARAEAVKAEKRAVKRLRQYLGEPDPDDDTNTASYDGRVIVEQVIVRQRRFNGERFAADHPDLDAEYREETEFVRVDLAENI